CAAAPRSGAAPPHRRRAGPAVLGAPAVHQLHPDLGGSAVVRADRRGPAHARPAGRAGGAAFTGRWGAMREVGVIDACYRFDLSRDRWVAELSSRLETFLDVDRLGTVVGTYRCEDPCSLRPEIVVVRGIPDRLREVHEVELPRLSAAYVAATFASGSMGSVAGFPGWDDIPSVRDGAM